jgi:hypothetical protein
MVTVNRSLIDPSILLQYIRAGFLKEYDLSPQERERHDREIEAKRRRNLGS